MRSLPLIATVLVFSTLIPSKAAGAIVDEISRDSFEDIDCVADPQARGCPELIGATPNIELSPGEADVYCYYFRAGNDAAIELARTHAAAAGVVTSVQLHATHNLLGLDVERMPPSSISTLGCGLLVALDGTVATLLANLELDGTLQIVDDALGSIPTTIRPDQPLFLKITMANPGNAMANGSVRWVVTPTEP